MTTYFNFCQVLLHVLPWTKAETVILHEEEHDRHRHKLIAFIEKGTENTEGGTKVGVKVTDETDKTPVSICL